MIVRNAKKVSKIIDELFLYLLKHGYKNINLNVNTENDIRIDITVQDLEERIIEKLEERLKDKREVEVEEYGWELMGESDCSNELELIGLLIDSFSYKNEGNSYTLTFIRKNK